MKLHTSSFVAIFILVEISGQSEYVHCSDVTLELNSITAHPCQEDGIFENKEAGGREVIWVEGRGAMESCSAMVNLDRREHQHCKSQPSLQAPDCTLEAAKPPISLCRRVGTRTRA